MKFRYTAFERSGKSVSTVIDAPDAQQAIDNLRFEGLYVTEIKAVGEESPELASGRRRRVRGGTRLKHLSGFARQMHVLVAGGTPLIAALAAIERQITDSRWRVVVTDLRQRVEEGASLSQAMTRYPEYFDSICLSLVSAGESGGNMAEMLQRLASLLRKQLHLRGSIAGAMVYPSLLLVAGVGVLGVMLFFVLPRFVGLFKTLDVALPPTTRMLMSISDGLQSYWWAALALAIGTAVGLRAWAASAAGKRAIQILLLRLPRIGGIAQSLILARIARLLGVLLEGKVPLIDSLRLVQQGAGNVRYAELIARAEDAVSKGEPMSSVLAQSTLVSPAVCEAVRNGEQSGNVGPLLLQIADFLDEDNEVVVRSLTSIIEPVILICMGAVVAFIAISMFLPLFDLAAAAQGGGH